MSAKNNKKENSFDTGLRVHARNDGKGETAPILDSGSTAGMTAEGETAPILDSGSGGAQRAGVTETADSRQQHSGMTLEGHSGMTKKKLSNSALSARLRFLACNFRALRDRDVMRQELKDLLERC